MDTPGPGQFALSCLLAIALLAACDRNSGPAPSHAAPEGADTVPPRTTAPALEETDPITLAADAMTESSFRHHIEVLSSDEFGGRAPGSAGEELTVGYLIEAFKDLGLEPANGERYTQDVPLVWIKVTNSPDLVIRDTQGNKLVLKYATDQVVWTQHQAPEAAVKNSEMVFVGYGINAPEYGWNDYAGVDVKGKTVVMLVNDPGYATQDPELFRGNTMTYYGRWDYKFGEAARQGAAAALIIHDRLPAAYPWSTVANSWTGRKFRMQTPDRGLSLAQVEGWMTREQAARVFSEAGLSLDEMYENASRRGFHAVPMDLTASVALQNETAALNSRNVAAVLRGSDAPDEVFIYMAHWDHLGTDPGLEGDQIYNGALDNASGTAALLEIAKAFATLPRAPRRSVLFLSTTAEEQGLLGSLYYAAHPLFPLADTVGGINMDGMNFLGPTRDITVIGLGMSDLDDYLSAAVAAQERMIVPDREAEKGYYYRSDHFELARQGVPMLSPKKGYDDRERGLAYGMEKANEYTNEHYHRVSDEYDPAWVVSGALEDMRLYFETGLEIANGNQWPNWKEGTEFRATRDAQRANR